MPDQDRSHPNQQPQPQPTRPEQPPQQPPSPERPHTGTGSRRDHVEPSEPWPRKK